MKKVGLFGGTFDPVHIGHLIMAEEVYQQLQLDEIWFIPSYVPPHKIEATTNATDRLEMLKLAIKSNDHFLVNDIELKRRGTSYTIETIKTLKEMYEHHEFYFIIGGDMVEYLPKWYKIDELVGLVNFVGVKRVGYKLQSKYPIILVNVPLIEISSTALRERLTKGLTVRYWLQGEVREYIREKGLYGFKGSVK